MGCAPFELCIDLTSRPQYFRLSHRSSATLPAEREESTQVPVAFREWWMHAERHGLCYSFECVVPRMLGDHGASIGPHYGPFGDLERIIMVITVTTTFIINIIYVNIIHIIVYTCFLFLVHDFS